MITKKYFCLPSRLLFAAFLSTVVSCAAPQPAEDDIARRAQERWDTLASGDFFAAYQYLSPGYRSSVSSNAYQRKLLLQRVRWKNARYIESECLENSCKVKISLDYVLVAPVPGLAKYEGTRIIVEDWVKSGGQWWHVPEK